MRRVGGIALAVYVILLAASHLYRLVARPDFRVLNPGRKSISVTPLQGVRALPGETELAWIEWNPPADEDDDHWPVVLVHGSPGDAANFRRFAPWLSERGFPVLAPDLPGFGASSHDVPDYSLRAHAGYVGQLLDAEGIERAHLLGFSMGGGVVLELWRQEPERVASLTLLAAIGVQEAELLGNYHLNHLVHGLQLGALWGLRELTPHFGALDRFPLDVAYARNFYDSDQRPLRQALFSFEPPALIVHGEYDPLVPAMAAREHHRLMPHSELLMLDASHFFVFDRDRSRVPADVIVDFLSRVEAGEALRRGEASPERLRLAAEPWDPSQVPLWEGPALLSIVFLLALATFISEDLTCLGAGLLVAQGRLGLLAAILGCFIGIVIGDFALFWLGRWVGRPALRVPPLSWWVTPERVASSSEWLKRRGAGVVFLSRFMPGARLPTNLAAGLLHTSFLRFSLYFIAAALIWTPLVVGIASQLGEAALDVLDSARHTFLWALLLLALVMFTTQQVALPLCTHRGRRRLLGRWKRLRHWEFWPMWMVYPPVVLWILWLGVRHRSLTLFTAANPAIPAGGWIGESKSEIYLGLEGSGVIPAWGLVPATLGAQERIESVDRFLDAHGLDYPVVLKPDAGQRGKGVLIARCRQAVESYFGDRSPATRPRPDTLVQEFAEGEEFGVFYYRYPDEENGSIFAITEKRAPVVTGDGERTIEQLVLDDSRAVAMADVYLDQIADPNRIPPSGERVALAEVGAHARGTIFLDGQHLRTPMLEAAVEKISQSYEGFDVGRYDLKAPSAEALTRGEGIRILELNGVTSEPTNIYDSRYSIWDAWRILCRQWSITFEIGRQRRDAGARVTGIPTLLRMWWKHRD